MSNEVTRHPNGAVRSADGKLQPGHRMGRLTKAKEMQALAAINSAMPPQEIELLIRDALSWCRHYKSVKGAISLLQLVLSYQLGQPVKRSVSASVRVQDILESVGDMDDEQFEQTIDALYESNKE